ncbi:hypothetical protein EK599_15415 [Vibrio sp. T187]|nr:hypothetical protein [Vibrio sp. T187]
MPNNVIFSRKYTQNLHGNETNEKQIKVIVKPNMVLNGSKGTANMERGSLWKAFNSMKSQS